MKYEGRVILPGDKRTKLIFFAGKGGVGKTSVSCITAVYLADLGYSTLLLTTDPAAHLGDVLDQPVEEKITAIKGVNNLSALKIEPKRAALGYKERILADAKANNYSDDMMLTLREELDSPCTEEMAVFDEFVSYADDDQYDVIVFDTAPTGHTLRLLELPMSWEKQLQLKADMSTINEGDIKAQERFKRIIERMKSKEQTTFAFVLYPENTPIQEAYRAVIELGGADIETQLVVVNQVLPREVCITPYFNKRREMQDRHLEAINERFKCNILQLPLFPEEIKGLEILREAGRMLYE